MSGSGGSWSRKAGLALLSGLLWGAVLSGRDFSWLAWIAWVPLLIALNGCTGRQAFGLGALAGFFQTVCLLFWIPDAVIKMQHSLSLGLLLLGCLAAVWGTTLGCCCLVFRWFRVTLGTKGSSPGAVFGFVIVTTAAWVTCEFAYARLVPFLPWIHFFAGLSQWNCPGILQVSAATGIYGVSFLVLIANTGLSETILRRSLVPAMGAAILVFSVWGMGRWRMRETPQTDGIRVAVLQGNIDPGQKLDPERGNELAQRYLLLSEKANDARPGLVVWTESAIPWPLRSDDDLVAAALGKTKSSQAWHLIGAPVESEDHPGNYLNSVVLVQPDGQAVGKYSKVRPLVMAETPLPLPGAGFKLHPSPASHVRGVKQTVLPSPFGLLGVNICNENYHADLVRESVRKGARCLVNVTNDGWFRYDTALRQHFMMNPLRAVENRRPLIVANNVGMSAIIDEHGRLHETAPPRNETCLVGEIQPREGLSFYTTFGDVFAYGCAVLSTAAGAWHPLARLRNGKI
jgi:apolipoprotein N-acyltransferase